MCFSGMFFLIDSNETLLTAGSDGGMDLHLNIPAYLGMSND